MLVSDEGKKAFDKAQEMFDSGAHFLLGTRGETPKPASSTGFRLFHPELDRTMPMVCTARGHASDLSTQVCVGRPLHPDVKRAGGRVRTRMTHDLRTYLSFLEVWRDMFKQPQEMWPPFKTNGVIKLTPRTFAEEDSTGALINVITLGESCVGKIHVDCIGLVNLCLKAGKGRDIRFGITQIENGTAFGKSSVVFSTQIAGANTTPGANSVRHGDIVIKHENHIGICGMDASGQIQVIEATGSNKGIIKTSFRSARALDSDKWRSRVRVFR